MEMQRIRGKRGQLAKMLKAKEGTLALERAKPDPMERQEEYMQVWRKCGGSVEKVWRSVGVTYVPSLCLKPYLASCPFHAPLPYTHFRLPCPLFQSHTPTFPPETSCSLPCPPILSLSLILPSVPFYALPSPPSAPPCQVIRKHANQLQKLGVAAHKCVNDMWAALKQLAALELSVKEAEMQAGALADAAERRKASLRQLEEQVGLWWGVKGREGGGGAGGGARGMQGRGGSCKWGAGESERKGFGGLWNDMSKA